MLRQSNLPYELWTSIVDVLGDEMNAFDPYLGPSTDTKDLQALSLVCKSMVPLCRKHLFYSLEINTDTEDSGLSHRFECLLILNPSLISYIRHLNYAKLDSKQLREEPHNTVILEVLKSRSGVRLQRVDVWLYGITWNELPHSLKSALEHLIRLPTISELDLNNIDGVPRDLLSGCGNNLSRICLRDITFELTGACPTTTPKPKYLYVAEGAHSAVRSLMDPDLDRKQRILDLSGLKEVSFYISELPGEKEIAWEVLQIMPGEIEYLGLQTIDGPSVMWTGLAAALSHGQAIHTLRKLSVATSVIGNDYDPLCGLVAELQMTAGVNRLEKIELIVYFDIMPGDTEDWSAFDNLLVTSGSFPRLAYVYIEWYTPTKHLDPGEVQALKDTMFQSLKSSRAVELRFEVIEY